MRFEIFLIVLFAFVCNTLTTAHSHEEHEHGHEHADTHEGHDHSDKGHAHDHSHVSTVSTEDSTGPAAGHDHAAHDHAGHDHSHGHSHGHQRKGKLSIIIDCDSFYLLIILNYQYVFISRHKHSKYPTLLSYNNLCPLNITYSTNAYSQSIHATFYSLSSSKALELKA